MAIEKGELLAFGMKETEGDEKTIFPLKKVISHKETNYPDDLGRR